MTSISASFLARALRAFWPAPVVAGALLWAAFPPLDLGWLAPAGWTVLFASMRLRRGAKAGRQALVAGLVLFAPGLRWIAPLVVAGWLFTAAWCAAFEGLYGWLLARALLRREGAPPLRWVVAGPAIHLAVDVLRTVVATGFPWLLTGYTGWRNPVLLGSADLLGVHGSTLAVLVLAAGAAEALARKIEAARRAAAPTSGWAPLVPAAALWALLAAWAFGKPAVAERPGPTVALLQANIAQRLKEDMIRAGTRPPSVEEWWRLHETLGAAARVRAAAQGRRIDVVVWPETMVPATALHASRRGEPLLAAEWGARQLDPRVAERLAAIAGGAQTLAGILATARSPAGGAPEQWNTVVLLDSEGRLLGSQDKQHLTPGGEYIPLRRSLPFRERLEAWLEDMAGFLPDLRAGEGTELLPVARPGGEARAGVLVCYESIFPELCRGMVRDGAEVLVNCSNYGWFAGTAEMEQALAMASFRAAELRRPLVLAGNNGVSAVIGPDGRPRAFVEDARGGRADVEGFLVAEVPLGGGLTPFARLGEWGGAFAAGGLGLVAALARRRRAGT